MYQVEKRIKSENEDGAGPRVENGRIVEEKRKIERGSKSGEPSGGGKTLENCRRHLEVFGWKRLASSLFGPVTERGKVLNQPRPGERDEK